MSSYRYSVVLHLLRFYISDLTCQGENLRGKSQNRLQRRKGNLPKGMFESMAPLYIKVSYARWFIWLVHHGFHTTTTTRLVWLVHQGLYNMISSTIPTSTTSTYFNHPDMHLDLWEPATQCGFVQLQLLEVGLMHLPAYFVCTVCVASFACSVVRLNCSCKFRSHSRVSICFSTVSHTSVGCSHSCPVGAVAHVL